MLDLSSIGLTEVPVFGRYEYCSARPGLTTHVHPHAVEICYLERGCQTYRTGGREYHLVGGDVFVMAPGEPHDTGGHVEERGILYWMNLNIPKAGESILMLPAKESALLVHRISTLPHPHFPGKPALKQIFNEIFSFCEQPKELLNNSSMADQPAFALLTRIAIANQLVRFILETINCAHRHEGIRRSPVISRLVERIKSSPGAKLFAARTGGRGGVIALEVQEQIQGPNRDWTPRVYLALQDGSSQATAPRAPHECDGCRNGVRLQFLAVLCNGVSQIHPANASGVL